jgi:hypothetical protein
MVLGSKEGVMSENTISLALRNVGYAGNVMTAHAFRSMASTLLNESGFAHLVSVAHLLAWRQRIASPRRMRLSWSMSYLTPLMDT